MVALDVAGAALFYGDGIITPILPITLILLIGLFAIQKHGTAKVGAMFGPIMVVWFVAIGTFGAIQITHNPVILSAFNPLWGVRFLMEDPMRAFMVMGSVVLAVTGGEALYADMGHFGRNPIKLAWFTAPGAGRVSKPPARNN